MKIRGGYILQPRCIDNSDVSKMPPVTRELWQHILRNVNHKENGKFKRGSGFFNLGDIQETLCWYVGYRKMVYSKPQLTKSLRRLCGDNMIATAKATRGLHITVCNYDFYQDPKNYEGNDEGHTKETRRKRQGHTKNKNVKNVIMKEKKIYKKYGQFENVLLTDDELKKLKDKFNSSFDDKIENLSLGIESKGYKYKSHYATILAWSKKDKKIEPVEKDIKSDNPKLAGKIKKLSLIASGMAGHEITSNYAGIGESFDDMKQRAAKELRNLKEEV